MKKAIQKSLAKKERGVSAFTRKHFLRRVGVEQPRVEYFHSLLHAVKSIPHSSMLSVAISYVVCQLDSYSY